MKSLQKLFHKFQAHSLKFFLSAIGITGAGLFVSCTKYGVPAPEYGAPENYIRLHGKVVSADSLKPIPNITVNAISQNNDTSKITTNEVGNYEVYKTTFEGEMILLQFMDTDGLLHGNFEDKSLHAFINANNIDTHDHEENTSLIRKP